MRSDDLYLAEILEATAAVQRYLERGGTAWLDDPVIQDAVLYRLTVVGESAGAVSEELRSRHPEVPWPRIRAFRNTAIHEYFAIDWALVQPIAEVETPRLHMQILAIVRAEFPEIAKRHEEET